MQKEIMNKTRAYGVIAIILAVILGAFCLNFGIISPVFHFPSPPASLSAFSSYDELKSYIMANSRTQGSTWNNIYPETFGFPSGRLQWQTDLSATTKSGSSAEYSGTNIQVAGVDEADIVKTDGEYIYVVSGVDNYNTYGLGRNVTIVRAYPPEDARIMSKLVFNNARSLEIFVSRNRLAVLGSMYGSMIRLYHAETYSYGYQEPQAFIYIYDLIDRERPELVRNFTISGEYRNSRMIGDYAYIVSSRGAEIRNGSVILPVIQSGEASKEIAPSEIYHSETYDESFVYTTFMALNMQNFAETPTYMTLMIGWTSSMYVSLDNIYVTIPGYSQSMVMNARVPLLQAHVEETSIYRIRIKNNTMDCEAQGKVPGREHDQFSMDEYNNYFRIVTTTWMNDDLHSNLYVLNINLSIVGSLENLGLKEYLHSTRFMENRCYIVTFKKTDPLFVIDLSQPTNPTVLGELKIPGYSDYLHLYDGNHIIGVGKETVEAQEGDFAWYQGVKISLFDVTNVNSPVQLANYTIGDRGTDSPVLSDHKAFLFDRSKNLLSIPIKLAEIDESQYPNGVPPYVCGTDVWQGAYVFRIDLDDGIALRSRITHGTEGAGLPAEPYQIRRTLYIGNILYTVSDKKIRMHSLTDLVPIGKIDIP